MGGMLNVEKGDIVTFNMTTKNSKGYLVKLISNDGVTLPLVDSKIATNYETKTYEHVSNGTDAWIRMNVVDSEGRILLLGNPIYLRKSPKIEKSFYSVGPRLK